MTKLEILNDAVHIDSSIVAQGLGFEPSFVHTMMREGEITSLCERGVDEDAGRYRLTFFHKSRRFRIIVDETGKVIQRSIIDFGDRLLPATVRKPGAYAAAPAPSVRALTAIVKTIHLRSSQKPNVGQSGAATAEARAGP